jgi:hypothetical protein
MDHSIKITVEDDIDACDGDQILGIFMHKLYAWADSTKAGLTKNQGHPLDWLFREPLDHRAQALGQEGQGKQTPI